MASDWPDPVDFYAAHSADFANARSTGLAERPWLEAFAALLPQDGTVLDVGCGTGEPIAAWLLDQGLRVTGVDPTRAFIERARARLPRGEWIEADMRGLDLGRRFDGLVVWDSLFHLSPDAQRAMFATFADHAAPNAPLLFNSGTALGEGTSPNFGKPLYHASLATLDYCVVLYRAGFQVVRHQVEDPACGGRTIWLAKRT